MLSIVLLVSLAFFGFKYGSCNDWNIILLCAPVMKKNDEEYIVAEKYSGMEKFISQGSGTFSSSCSGSSELRCYEICFVAEISNHC